MSPPPGQWWPPAPPTHWPPTTFHAPPVRAPGYQWGPLAAPGPVTTLGQRIGARLLDLLLVGVVSGLLLFGIGDSDRPLANLVIIAAVLFAYETVFVSQLGTTIGKSAVGLRVIELDSPLPPEWGPAARRALADAGLGLVPVIGQLFWLFGLAGDPVRRGFADRVAGTMVVPSRAVLPIRSRDLPGYADGARAPRLTTLGRVGDADVRFRARLRRLTDLPVLSALVGLLALGLSAVDVSLLWTGLALLIWLVAFVVDETRRLHSTAETPGHELAGLLILDTQTGQAPSTGRAFWRSLVLGLTLYVPLLWPLLGATALMMTFSQTGRGLHDYAGRTIVVADARLDPEEQRQRAMGMRLGRAG